MPNSPKAPTFGAGAKFGYVQDVRYAEFAGAKFGYVQDVRYAEFAGAKFGDAAIAGKDN